jgi:hypothetical protein
MGRKRKGKHPRSQLIPATVARPTPINAAVMESNAKRPFPFAEGLLWVAGLLIGAALTLSGRIDVRLAKWSLGAVLLLTSVAISYWEHQNTKRSRFFRYEKTVLAGVICVLGMFAFQRWLYEPPSFVFLRPAWDEQRQVFYLTVIHRGPRPVANIKCEITDIAYAEKWLIDQNNEQRRRAAAGEPQMPFPYASEFTKKLTCPESFPGDIQTTPCSMVMKPLNNTAVSYNISIDTHEGSYKQYLLLKLIGGKWRAAVGMRDYTHNKVVMNCRDIGAGGWVKFIGDRSPHVCTPEFPADDTPYVAPSQLRWRRDWHQHSPMMKSKRRAAHWKRCAQVMRPPTLSALREGPHGPGAWGGTPKVAKPRC